MARPSIEPGRGVKVFEPPAFGRQDARATAVDNQTGIITAQIVADGRVVAGLAYCDDLPADSVAACWRELPIDFTPGSQG
jgi:hypothetical protein